MEIKGFKAFRFDQIVVGNAGDCVSPPYDVIDPDQQSLLYEKNQYNVVRIIKGKICENDSQSNNQYVRAGEFLDSWIKAGALKQDEQDSIYAYVQNFTAGSQSLQRSGFVALGKLAEFGDDVKPHEKTLDGPKADRLNLTRATQAQFGQIFMLFDDPKKVADKIIDKSVNGDALIDFTDSDNVRHRLFAIADPQQVEAIAEMMTEKDAVIADGHHRYETALNYYKESKNPAAQYRMMTFVNMHNEGLVILPTHRLLGSLENFEPAELIKKLADDFEITKFSIDEKTEMFAAMKNAFDAEKIALGLYQKDDAFYCLVLKSKKTMESLAPELSEASKTLDVSVLHKVILDTVLGIGDKQLASQSNIEYIKDIGNAIDKSIARIDSSEKQAVFFMNPTRIEQVQAIAQAGEKMPQKSTFFHPKIFTGLTINKLN